MELLNYLKGKFDCPHRVSVERVVSGKGLANVYQFLAEKYPERVDAAVHEEFLKAGDQQGRVVGVNSGKEGSLTAQVWMPRWLDECNFASTLSDSAFCFPRRHKS